jgi:methionyl-tRNA formyltransferase
MRIFIAGQKLFGAEVLRICIDRGHEVVGIASPAFADDGHRPDRLRAAGDFLSLPWMEASELRMETLPAGTDLIVAAHSTAFIGRRTRLKARLGGIGYHPSLLPLHRGRDAVRWAIRMRERVTGGTVYWLSDGIDSGDVAAQEHVFIRPDDSLQLIGQVLDDLSAGVMVRIPQRHDLATWEPAIDRQPVFRPELPQLGHVPGFDVVCR